MENVEKKLRKKTKLSIAIDIGTMTTGTPGATQSLRPTAPRMVDVAAIGKKKLRKKTKLSIRNDIGTMQTSAPGATQSLRPTGPRMLDVVAIGRKRASEKILSPA